MKSKNMMIAAIVGSVLIIGGILFWVNSGRIEGPSGIVEETVEEQTYETIDPSEIGLTLRARADRRAVIMEITKLSGIQMIDYELSYLAKGDIPRGVIGSVDVKSTDTKITRELLLGTCSRNVCKYDEGVTSVTLVAKITKSDGTVLQAEQTLDL